MDPKEYRLAAIMFTDIVGFSRMMEENEKATLKLLEYHNEIVQKHTEELRGSVIKTIGDAFLIDFPNTVNAVNCAVRIQQDLEERNRNNPEFTLVLRIGVHLGDIYFTKTMPSVKESISPAVSRAFATPEGSAFPRTYSIW
jgi:adenylate cyclase